MERGVSRIQGEVAALLAELERQGLETGLLGVLLEGWMGQLRLSAAREVARFSGFSTVRSEPLQVSDPAEEPTGTGRAGPRDDPLENHSEVPGDVATFLAAAAAGLECPGNRLSFFGRHARTFRFASRLFPRDALEKVAGVYAFCRFTDDLVDEADGSDPGGVERRLDAWLELSRAAYRGEETGVPLLDQVLGTARTHGVPFSYVEELVEGVRMDIRPVPFESLEDLRVYSFRVASVVGGWLTELFGIRDPWVLERAFALGHAMQLTNILRDVGEDLWSGRVYLPLDHMVRFGVDRDLLEAQAREGSPMFPGYRMLLEDLMTRADADYARAFQAIPALPPFFQGPVAVAARAYQAIHDGIRKNGYNNLTRRARTSLLRKLTVGARALLDLSLLKRRSSREGGGLEKAPDARHSGFGDAGFGDKAVGPDERQEAVA